MPKRTQQESPPLLMWDSPYRRVGVVEPLFQIGEKPLRSNQAEDVVLLLELELESVREMERLSDHHSYDETEGRHVLGCARVIRLNDPRLDQILVSGQSLRAWVDVPGGAHHLVHSTVLEALRGVGGPMKVNTCFNDALEHWHEVVVDRRRLRTLVGSLGDLWVWAWYLGWRDCDDGPVINVIQEAYAPFFAEILRTGPRIPGIPHEQDPGRFMIHRAAHAALLSLVDSYMREAAMTALSHLQHREGEPAGVVWF